MGNKLTFSGISRLESDRMISFKCPKCGFFFSLESYFENMDKKEYEEITACPCGEQMEEVEYSEDMIPTINI